MAQGQALSAFVRLYKVTHDAKYLKWAEQTFNSLARVQSNNIDAQRYIWFEEYPMDTLKTQVLNGYIFAILGLYDYYQLTHQKKVKSLLQGGLTTIRDNVHLCRVPGGKSLYCLKHKHQSQHYHMVHIVQLEELYDITGVPYFRKMKNAFQSDSKNPVDLLNIKKGKLLQ